MEINFFGEEESSIKYCNKCGNIESMTNIMLLFQNRWYCKKCHPKSRKRNKLKEKYIEMKENPMDKFVSQEESMQEYMNDI